MSHERSFYIRSLGEVAGYLSIIDLQYMFYSATSGLSEGSILDHMRAFYKARLDEPESFYTLNDLEKAYYNSLGIDTTMGLAYAEREWWGGTVDITTGAWTAPE